MRSSSDRLALPSASLSGSGSGGVAATDNAKRVDYFKVDTILYAYMYDQVSIH